MDIYGDHSFKVKILLVCHHLKVEICESDLRLFIVLQYTENFHSYGVYYKNNTIITDTSTVVMSNDSVTYDRN